jgi:hypothetical protein
MKECEETNRDMVELQFSLFAIYYVLQWQAYIKNTVELDYNVMKGTEYFVSL